MTATKKTKKATRFDAKTEALLKTASDFLTGKGYLVFDSQWMQNPKCHDQFVAPVMLKGDDDPLADQIGYVMVSPSSGCIFCSVMIARPTTFTCDHDGTAF